jgi:hypothetical protein
MIRQMTQSRATAFIFVVALLCADSAVAHGKVSLEEDNCVRWAGGNAVHFTAYQPQHDPGAQYCTEIPKEGETFLVVDLVDPILRDMPVELRVVKGTSEIEGETVMHLRAGYHPDGVIRGESSLDPGQYTLFVTGEGSHPLHYQYALRVKMINYFETFRTATGSLLVLLLFILLANKILKSEWGQRWRRLL